MNINLIPFGKENRIGRKRLMELAKIQTEKEFNTQLADLRKEYIIMTDASTGGYWRCNDKKEMQEFIKKYQHKNYDASRMILLAYKEMEEMK